MDNYGDADEALERAYRRQIKIMVDSLRNTNTDETRAALAIVRRIAKETYGYPMEIVK